MIIRPKKYKYEKPFRNKKSKNFQFNKLVFGTIGIRTLSKLVFTTKQLNKYIIFIKKYIKKMERTQKKFWFFYSLNTNLTKKPKGSRMGKGKGKPYIWNIIYSNGSYIFEFKNIRKGKVKYIKKKFNILLNSKLNVKMNNSQNLIRIYNMP